MNPVTTAAPSLDLAAYLRRVEYEGALEPTEEVLRALHLAHATHIPFENLDILLGRPIRLDLDSLQAKLVGGGRGGYCFEQNSLFAAVLEEVGFPVTRLAARVRYGTQAVLPRTHMLMLVRCDGRTWLADVGFGAEGLLHPVPFGKGEVSEQFSWSYRVVQEEGLWVLQSLHGDGWTDLYAFTLEPQHAVDYEMANHFTSTHPESRFRKTVTAQLAAPGVRRILRGGELTVDEGENVTRRAVGPDELLAVLDESFGLRLTEEIPIPPSTFPPG
ncbi:MAG: arylamine N-acetyltransferase family protein [Longimicrobiaceae bacterium]